MDLHPSRSSLATSTVLFDQAILTLINITDRSTIIGLSGLLGATSFDHLHGLDMPSADGMIVESCTIPGGAPNLFIKGYKAQDDTLKIMRSPFYLQTRLGLRNLWFSWIRRLSVLYSAKLKCQFTTRTARLPIFHPETGGTTSPNPLTAAPHARISMHLKKTEEPANSAEQPASRTLTRLSKNSSPGRHTASRTCIVSEHDIVQMLSPTTHKPECTNIVLVD
ncbi:unnamed protein product [Cyclocybe aegerita]|uniref:Uncharacterized protein n=1 Tax=Cyclocybe aegerita TaxID=1973307 RepID=A0A8S0VRG6_CYCAE|nr:unnamed protein product [Cyclocybe aegerita]